MNNKHYQLFNPEVITWAIARARYTHQELAKKLHIKEERLSSWCTGQDEPSFLQAERLAKAVCLSVSMLMLNKIPKMLPDLPDFRTPESKPLVDQSIELEESILDALLCQNWYRDYLKINDIICKSSSIFSKIDTSNIDKTAQAIITKLDIENIRNKSKTESEFLKTIIRHVEHDFGVCVMRAGTLKNNNKSHLDFHEFRGFALSDPIAPLIFINTKDILVGQVFTLIHELAHIAKGDSGVSGTTSDSKEEHFANAVAGKVLIPLASITSLHNTSCLLESAKEIAKKLKVSTWAILTRAVQARIITQTEYNNAVTKIKISLENTIKKGKGGPNYYVTKFNRFGQNLSYAMISAVKTGQLLYRDMGEMTGIAPGNINKFVEKIEQARSY